MIDTTSPTTTNKDPLIHFPFYINQYQGLLAGYSFLERGAFITLLCVFLAEDGQIPTEESKLFRITGAFENAERLALSAVKSEVLRIGNQILEIQKLKRDKCREAARLGGLKSKRTLEQTLEQTGKRNGSNTEIETETETKKDIETKTKSEKFIPPTLQEVLDYCKERKNNVDPEKFFDYYKTAGWRDGKGNKVKNWKQKIITWEKNATNNNTHNNEYDKRLAAFQQFENS